MANLSGTAEKLTLSVLEGALNVTTTTGLTNVSGTGTAVVTLIGPLSPLNPDLASLTYMPTTGYNGRDTLSLTDTDTVDGLVGTGSVAITVNPLPPTISAPASLTVDENSSIALTGVGNQISVGDLSGTAEQMTLVLHGTLDFEMTPGLTVSGNNTASVTLSGSVGNLNTALASLSDTPTNGYNGTDTLSLSEKDTADSLAASDSIPITVKPLPPTVNAAGGERLMRTARSPSPARTRSASPASSDELAGFAPVRRAWSRACEAARVNRAQASR